MKQVVVKHGGMIRIGQPVPGGDPPGTSFYVLLPGSPTGLTYHSASAHSEINSVKGYVNGVHGNASTLPSVISVESQ